MARTLTRLSVASHPILSKVPFAFYEKQVVLRKSHIRCYTELCHGYSLAIIAPEYLADGGWYYPGQKLLLDLYYRLENRCFTLQLPTTPDYAWKLNNMHFWLIGGYPFSASQPLAKEFIWNTSKDGGPPLKRP